MALSTGSTLKLLLELLELVDDDVLAECAVPLSLLITTGSLTGVGGSGGGHGNAGGKT